MGAICKICKNAEFLVAPCILFITGIKICYKNLQVQLPTNLILEKISSYYMDFNVVTSVH